MKLAVFLALGLVALPFAASAGDAFAVGYNADGVWTAVTYYCSSTPKGGSDYKNEADARQAAALDLKKRASEGMVKTEIISASDRTGHFAYARGKAPGGKKDFHAVGFGGSKQEAEKHAFQQLNAQGAKLEQKVFFNYFSHGADAPSAAAKK